MWSINSFTSSLLNPWKGWTFISSNFHFLLTLLVAASLLISIPLCSLTIGLLFLNWIAADGFKGIARNIWKEKEGFLLPAFFFLHIAGLLYSANWQYGLSDLERKLSLVVLPLVLLTRPLSLAQKDAGLAFFTGFALILSIVGLSRGWMNYELIARMHGPEHLITHFTDMHRVYFSIYLFFCYLSVIYLFLKYQSWLSFWQKCIIGLVELCLIAFIFIMASRMVMILLILSTGAILFYFIVIKHKNYMAALIVLVAGALVLVTLFTQVEYLHRFMSQLTEKLDAGQTGEVNSVNIRVVKYKCAMQGIEKHWLWGVGTGDIQDTLNHLYKINGFKKGFEVNMDAHNQYFQTLLAQGSPGLLFLVVFLIVNLRKGIIARNYPLITLLLLFAICCLSESLLTTQKGVVFLALFFPLTYFNTEKANLDK